VNRKRFEQFGFRRTSQVVKQPRRRFWASPLDQLVKDFSQVAIPPAVRLLAPPDLGRLVGRAGKPPAAHHKSGSAHAGIGPIVPVVVPSSIVFDLLLVSIPKWGLAPSLRGACPLFGMGAKSVLGMHNGGSELYNALELDDRKPCDHHWIVAWSLHRIVAYRKPMRRQTCYSL